MEWPGMLITGGAKNWTPSTRLLIGTMGGIAALQGSRTRGVPGGILTLIGFGLLARAASNFPAGRLVGLAPARRGFQVEKTMRVRAPADRVWELWSNLESFPRFMAHLREVRKIDEGRSHWVAVGPAGLPIEWDAVVTDWVPKQFVGWTSVEGSPIRSSGQVRLQPVSDSETQIDVQLTYDPPAGAPGHALASMLGGDPKQAMDEDLLRFKSLLESNQTSPTEGSAAPEELAAKEKPARQRRGRRGRGRKT